MTINEMIALFQLHDIQPKPSNGDPAFSKYNGQYFYGRINCNSNGKPVSITWDNRIEGQPHKDNILYVGYNDPSCSWNRERTAWEVVADED